MELERYYKPNKILKGKGHCEVHELFSLNLPIRIKKRGEHLYAQKI
jgi:hypothetical protein